MPYQFNCIVAILALASTLAGVTAAETVITAEFLPPPGLTSYFNVGAGMAVDPPAPTPFDNRLAQTFVASTSGYPATASLIADQPPSAFADLTVDVGRLENGLVAEVIATGTIAPEEFGPEVNNNPMAFNGVVQLLAIDQIVAGETYAIFFRSAAADANYRIYGTGGNRFADGAHWRSQNSPLYSANTGNSDLFFQVTVTPIPEPAACLLIACALPAARGLARRHRVGRAFSPTAVR